ncbi:hypothetical protein M2451_000092 [Dysgonomonas sp. PFB1-18]|uniref:RagB/SusD family nutrient uptake outer membrane protein n=1 Tax=unclassified Dysgonomonas TaxID=2630389 RepID=UPI0024749F14|nr:MULTISPECIES: RagB/SusD family nutrient uptake outer membrane protein [unclassified Dysgonomonas]MDH6307643.1 hypothetical protein [Dysgonomonas sp. PF1-14]MDH6337561.1 hypothetical protein [Dysgonomonas sp. PF1-16]MDH6378785.1 hypothetical protein [Dysgonomonas sp. PFB1-18]MDH6399203.1 hypothetical protein [Dysgonomonas sp. PF1-23]
MKKYIYIILVVCVGLLYPSCNNSLNTDPYDTVAKEVVFSTTEYAYFAVNGLNLLTAKQYLGSQGLNGEGTIKLWYGEYPGNNFVKDLPGWAAIINQQYMTNLTSIYLYYPWYYYYRLIGDANTILDYVDAAEGSEEDKKEIKARALTYRAYSYFMLSQLYCKRWSDSNGGTSQGMILRLESVTENDMPFSTLKETYDRVYKDLDQAIIYFGESKKGSSEFYDMTINAARAIYARAALTREDFATAATMAAAARADYPLMSNGEMLAGFSDPTSEWIWGSYGGSEQNLYYYSYQSYIAYNSSGSIVRLYPMCIPKELYAQIPETDVRRNWWYYPGDATTPPSEINVKTEAGKVVDAKIRSAYSKLPSNAITYNYMHFKIQANDLPGVGNTCHFRSSEMYLIEAEALVRQNPSKDADAQKLMIALNKTSGRDPNYNTTNTGQDLLEEIWKYRTIELWGEGFDWFDLKRTNRPVSRADRATGGSFISDLAVKIATDANNGWVWSTPRLETDYNTLSVLPQPSN